MSMLRPRSDCSMCRARLFSLWGAGTFASACVVLSHLQDQVSAAGEQVRAAGAASPSCGPTCAPRGTRQLRTWLSDKSPQRVLCVDGVWGARPPLQRTVSSDGCSPGALALGPVQCRCHAELVGRVPAVPRRRSETEGSRRLSRVFSLSSPVLAESRSVDRSCTVPVNKRISVGWASVCPVRHSALALAGSLRL